MANVQDELPKRSVKLKINSVSSVMHKGGRKKWLLAAEENLNRAAPMNKNDSADATPAPGVTGTEALTKCVECVVIPSREPRRRADYLEAITKGKQERRGQSPMSKTNYTGNDEKGKVGEASLEKSEQLINASHSNLIHAQG